jgi:hypothetical protein
LRQSSRFRRRGYAGALACTLATSAVVVATPAVAQTPAVAAPIPHTLTVAGSAQVKPKPRDRSSNASIAKSVAVARRKAIPLAVGNGQGRAATLAQATGVTLVELIATSSSSPSVPFYVGPYYGEDGTFGPGKYCGTVRSPIFRTDAHGRRKVVGTHKHRSCRVPTFVNVSLQMTWTTVPSTAPAAVVGQSAGAQPAGTD